MIDKSIRQHYENGKDVKKFGWEAGKKTIWDPIKQKYFPQDETGLDEKQLLKNVAGSAAKNLVTSKLTSKLAGTGLLSSLGPIGALLAMFLAQKGIGKGQEYLTQKGGALQAFQTGFGSPQEGRELRQLESRRADMLQRKDEGRNYSEKNLDMVTRAIAEAKGLDINNPNEMKNIDKPITQIQTARSITEAPRVIPPTPEVISPHLEGDTIMPTPITPTGTGGPPSITSRPSPYRDPIMDMVTKQTYASPAKPHGTTQTEKLETLLKNDPALALYNLANLKGFEDIADPTERAKAKEDLFGFFDPDTGMSYVRDLERLGTGDKTLDAELAATIGHEQTHALFENDPRFASILEKINLSKPRETPDEEGFLGDGTYMPYEQEELLTRLLDIQRYGEAAGSEHYLEDSPYALSLHPSGEYGIKGLTKTLSPFANEFTTLAKQLTTPVTQDPDTGSAQIAERIAAENRAKAEAAAAAAKAAAARAYTPPVRHHTGGNGGGGNGGGGRGSSPSDAPGSPFLKGGRVDKALGGRSRDI